MQRIYEGGTPSGAAQNGNAVRNDPVEATGTITARYRETKMEISG